MTIDSSLILLSPSDIAELAKVSRPVVSNWRRRNEDFPSPVGGTDARPLFSQTDVIAWLQERGHEVELPRPDAQLWALLNTVRGAAPLDGVTRLLLALAALKKQNSDNLELLIALEPGKQAPAVREMLTTLRNGVPNLTPGSDLEVLEVIDKKALSQLINAIAGIDTDQLAETTDLLLERVTRHQVKSGGEHGFIGSRTSRLLSALAQGVGGTVYDPASGIANVLLQVGTSGKATRLVGSEIDPAAIDVAAQRAYLRDLELELHLGDALAKDPVPDLTADTIVIEPPFGMRWDSAHADDDPRFSHGVPSRIEAELAWIQHALSHLAPNGRAFVIAPHSRLSELTSKNKIIESLLLGNHIESITTLPANMLPQSHMTLTLWALRPAEEGSLQVRFIDARDFEEPEEALAGWVLAEDSAGSELAQAFVPNSELLKGNAPLSPSKWVSDANVDEDKIQEDFAGALAAVLSSPLADPGGTLLTETFSAASNPGVVTIDELASQGTLTVVSGHHRGIRELPEKYQNRTVKPEHVSTGELPEPIPQDVAKKYDLELTKPGDIIVSATRGLITVVDHEGSRAISPLMTVLRVEDPEALRPEFLLAALSGSWNNRPNEPRSIMSMRRVRQAEIPALTPQAQATLVNELNKVRDIEETAQKLVSQAEALRITILDGIRYGVELDLSRASAQ